MTQDQLTRRGFLSHASMLALPLLGLSLPEQTPEEVRPDIDYLDAFGNKLFVGAHVFICSGMWINRRAIVLDLAWINKTAIAAVYTEEDETRVVEAKSVQVLNDPSWWWRWKSLPPTTKEKRP